MTAIPSGGRGMANSKDPVVRLDRRQTATGSEEGPKTLLTQRASSFPIAPPSRMRASNSLLNNGLKKLAWRASDPTKPVSKSINDAIYKDVVVLSESPTELIGLQDFAIHDLGIERAPSSSPSDRSSGRQSSRDSCSTSSQRHRSRESPPYRMVVVNPRSSAYSPRGSVSVIQEDREVPISRERELLLRVKDLEKSIKTFERERGQLRSDNQKLLDVVNQNEAQLTTRKHENEDLKSQLFDSIRQNRSPVCEDDERIRQKLYYCINRWKMWAYDFAASSLVHLDASARETVRTALGQHTSEGKVDSVFSFFFVEQKAHRMMKTLLFATVTKWITDFIIERPFHGLSEFQSLDGEASPTLRDNQSVLNDLYNMSQSDDEAVANDWRSRTVTLIESLKATTPRKRSYYRNLSRAFEAIWEGTIMRECNSRDAEERHEELYDMICEAGELFSSLMQQRFRVEVWGASKLCNDACSSRTSEWVEPTDTDVDTPAPAAPASPARRERSNANRNILMVITPAIVAYGNEKGTNYHQKKIWSKAQVRTM